MEEQILSGDCGGWLSVQVGLPFCGVLSTLCLGVWVGVNHVFQLWKRGGFDLYVAL